MSKRLMKKLAFAGVPVAGMLASASAHAGLVITAEEIAALVGSIDFSIVLPLILAAGGAVIAITMFKGSIMSVINMLSRSTQR
jgi:hypothetical protein